MNDSQANGKNIGRLGGDGFARLCIPALQSDETIYSWCSRFHRLNVGCNSKSTSQTLFDHPKAGLWHDIPGHMGSFQFATQSAFGDSRSLLRHRTIFGFHVPFLSEELEEELLSRLIAGENASVRKQLGYERIGLSELNPLKFCPECVGQQVQANGFAWWLNSQQVPTALVCPTHGEWLRRCTARQLRGVYAEFQNPLECCQTATDKGHDLTPASLEQLIRLSKWHEVHPEHRLTDETLRNCYLLQAKTQGCLAFDGTVRMQKVRDIFVRRYAELLQIFGSDFFGDLNGANAGFLAYMFRQLPSRRHPLKHYLLMNLLFSSIEEFFEVYRKVQDLDRNGIDGAFKAMLRDGQAKLIKLVTADGLPICHAAAEVGVSGSCATKFLNKSGLNVRARRPAIVGTAMEEELIELLRQGRGRSEIATRLGLRLAFIKDYLATRPTLKKAWIDAHRESQIQLHRAQLSNMLKQHSDLSIKSIRRIPGNGFQWLYTNDRDWLREVLPAIWKR